MEQFLELLATPTGKIISVGFIVFGIFDLMITRLPFMPIRKQIVSVENALLTTSDPSKKSNYQQKANALNMLKMITTLFGITLIAVGFFGLTR